MNNQSPLIPQGSLLEQKNKGRARAKILILCVLVFHGACLLALLMGGCGKDTTGGGAANANSNALASAASTQEAWGNPTPKFGAETTSSNAAETTATNPAPAPNPPVTPTLTNPAPPPVVTETTNPPPPVVTGARDYKIVNGDNFSTIARNERVKLQALKDANPGVDSKKLQIGQTIHIPARAAPSPAVSTPPAPGTTSEGAGGTTYVVKSGDNLSLIATQFGVKVKALRNANGLKTDKIKVGQKLKIPAKTTATATASAKGSGPAPASSAAGR